MKHDQAYSAKTQSLGLEGVGNARELGGYRTVDEREVKHGVLLRTAAPEGATEQDRRRLQYDLHLTKVLDFRMDMEHMALDESARGLDFADTRRIGILDENYYTQLSESIPVEDVQSMSPLQMIMQGVDMGLIGERMYVDFLEADCGKRGFAEVFAQLLAQPADEALLFHCTQGKDRTGLAAMLILCVLGVDEQTIIFDYLLTNTFNARLIERESQALVAAGVPAQKLDTYMLGFDKVYPQTMQNAMAHLAQTYGSVWGFVREVLGVSDADRRDLRNKYLAAV